MIVNPGSLTDGSTGGAKFLGRRFEIVSTRWLDGAEL